MPFPTHFNEHIAKVSFKKGELSKWDAYEQDSNRPQNGDDQYI